MMIPPLVRVGAPPPPSASDPDARYVVLTSSGWEIVRWHDDLAGMMARVPEPPTMLGSAIYASNVICWMPADGS